MIGAVVVEPGGQVFIDASTIGGAVTADRPALFQVCGSTIGGAVSASEATGFVVIGDPGDDACDANDISGAVVLRNNHHASEVVSNHIGGSLVLMGTTGTGPFAEDSRAEIEGNSLGGALVCSGNAPAPTNDGRPNLVGGARIGQCAGL